MTTLGHQPRPATETVLPAIESGSRKAWSGVTKLHHLQTSVSLNEQPSLVASGGVARPSAFFRGWITALGLCTTFVFMSTGSANCLDLAFLHLTSEDHAVETFLRVQNSGAGGTYKNLTLALAGTWATVTSDGIAFTLRIIAQGPSTLVGRTPDVDRSQLYRLQGVYDDAKGKVLFKLTQPSTGFTRTGSISLTSPDSFVGFFDQRSDNGGQITWSGTRRAH